MVEKIRMWKKQKYLMVWNVAFGFFPYESTLVLFFLFHGRIFRPVRKVSKYCFLLWFSCSLLIRSSVLLIHCQSVSTRSNRSICSSIHWSAYIPAYSLVLPLRIWLTHLSIHSYISKNLISSISLLISSFFPVLLFSFPSSPRLWVFHFIHLPIYSLISMILLMRVSCCPLNFFSPWPSFLTDDLTLPRFLPPSSPVPLSIPPTVQCQAPREGKPWGYSWHRSPSSRILENKWTLRGDDYEGLVQLADWTFWAIQFIRNKQHRTLD